MLDLKYSDRMIYAIQYEDYLKGSKIVSENELVNELLKKVWLELRSDFFIIDASPHETRVHCTCKRK